MKALTLVEVELVAHRLAQELMRFDEPIPAFSTRSPQILESCLNTPRQRFNKRDLYPGFINKAAIQFYLMIKNHPFQNGNKRMVVTTLLYFLYKQKKWLRVDNQELYNFAKWIAASPPRLQEEVVRAIVKFIKTYLISLA